MKSKILLLCIFSFLILQDILMAGAWAQPKDHYYLKLSYGYSSANSIFGMNFPSTFDNYNIYFYGEYGIFDQLTASLSMPLFKKSVNEANYVIGKTSGYLAGDLEIMLKYQFLEGPVVSTIALGSKLPIGYDVYDLPPIGNDEMDFDIKLLVGTSLYPLPIYITGDIGYRQRGGDFMDEINYSFEAGYTLFEKYLLRILTTGIKSTSSASNESDLLGFPLAQDQIRYGGGIIYILNKNIELDFTYLKTTSGKNIPEYGEFFIGIAIKN
jgi:hypothetical protein